MHLLVCNYFLLLGSPVSVHLCKFHDVQMNLSRLTALPCNHITAGLVFTKAIHYSLR